MTVLTFCYMWSPLQLAARVVSVAYLCGAVLNVLLAVGTQGITLAFYSLGSFAFALAIFGTLIYGIFKEKRPFILPYMIFQVIYLLKTLYVFHARNSVSGKSY